MRRHPGGRKLDELDNIIQPSDLCSVTRALEQPVDSRPDYTLPSEVPVAWRQDVSRVEALMDALRARHSEPELAQLIALAATRNLAGARRPRSGLAAAMVRGVLAREGLKDEEGGSVSAEEARRFLGDITKQAVLDRYRKGRLLGWRETRQNAVRFPVWQFTEHGLLPGLAEVLAILRASPAIDDWGAILFFLSPRDSLLRERPLDFLRRGDVAPVKAAAEGHVE